jgi:hypothetical protein
MDVEDHLDGPNGPGRHLGAVQNEMGTVLHECAVLAARRLALRPVHDHERSAAGGGGRLQLADEWELTAATSDETPGRHHVESIAAVGYLQRTEAPFMSLERFGTAAGSGAGK